MKNKLLKMNIIIMCFVIAIMTLVSVFAFFNTATISTYENRTLATKPQLNSDTWFSGSYALDFNSFLSDHVFVREDLVTIGRSIESILRLPSKMRIVDFSY